MKEFILSDLHIGYDGSQYDIMDRAVAYIRSNATRGDRVLGLGDWWHMNEKGFDYCLAHPMTGTFLKLAEEIPIRFMPGNHDHHLADYRDHPERPNPIAPISLIYPYAENGIYFCHGHEYDPEVQHLGWLPTVLGHFQNKKPPPRPYTGRLTPSYLREKLLSETYLMVVQLIYTRASLYLMKQARDEGKDYLGIVLGHTHLPFIQRSPELPFLLDDGDMRHSGTFAVKEGNRFDLMRWDEVKKTFVLAASVVV